MTGKPNVPNVPEGWRVVHLGDVAYIRGEASDPIKDESSPYIALEHIVSGGVLTGFGRSSDSISLKTKFRTGDTLYGKLRPNLRKAIRVNFDGVCSTEILAIYGKAEGDGGFLSHIIRSDQLHRHSMQGVAGTKMPRTSWGHLKTFEFMSPPLPEQRAVTAVLDSIDDAIERTEAVIAATEQLRDSLLHQLLTRGVPGWHTEWKEAPGLGTIPADWEVVRLGEVSETITSGSRAWSRYFRPNGAFFVRSQNMAIIYLCTRTRSVRGYSRKVVHHLHIPRQPNPLRNLRLVLVAHPSMQKNLLDRQAREVISISDSEQMNCCRHQASALCASIIHSP